MGGIFQRLHNKLELERREEGISPLDLADLPPNLRRLMRLMLREVEMYYLDLRKVVEEMPADQTMSQGELDQALKTLTIQNWLICRGEGERTKYSVNLRRKAGSKLAQGLWANLNEKIAAGQSAGETSQPPAEEGSS